MGASECLTWTWCVLPNNHFCSQLLFFSVDLIYVFYVFIGGVSDMRSGLVGWMSTGIFVCCGNHESCLFPAVSLHDDIDTLEFHTDG